MTTPLILDPSNSAVACVIWLHGLGADRYDFLPVAEALQQRLLSTRFVLPQAPTRPVTINGGWSMPSWYDILAMSPARAINRDQLEASAQQVISLLEAQRDAGIDPARIFLAGFSQGGAITLSAGLQRRAQLAGLVALSTYLPEVDAAAGQLAAGANTQPVFMAHGSADPVIPVQVAENSAQVLKALGFELEWHRYPMAHQVCAEEIHALGDWLQARFSAG